MSLSIETRFTRMVGIDLPIVQAGMSWASSCAALPAAVSGAGGLGVIAAGPMRRDDLKAAIAGVRAQTDRPFAVNVPLYRKEVDDILALLVDERVPVIIASQGGPDRYLDRFKAIGTLCLHVVASEVHAAKAAAKGVDGLVVVGGEAGGHPPPELVSTLVIGRAVAKAVPDLPIVLPRWRSAPMPRSSAPASWRRRKRACTRITANVSSRLPSPTPWWSAAASA
jgi:enoyl-[acyl-carrier protein] reductase II